MLKYKVSYLHTDMQVNYAQSWATLRLTSLIPLSRKLDTHKCLWIGGISKKAFSNFTIGILNSKYTKKLNGPDTEL